MPVGGKRHLALVTGRAHPRARHGHAPPAERDRPVLVGVTLGGPLGVVAALRANEVITSQAISSCNTPSPTPTESASSPSFAAPGSSPSAPLHPLGQLVRRLLGRGDLCGR
jgi:hypothetical protein